MHARPRERGLDIVDRALEAFDGGGVLVEKDKTGNEIVRWNCFEDFWRYLDRRQELVA
jgi:hypothetical protein